MLTGLKFGTEIECVFNGAVFRPPIGHYHEGTAVGKYWKTEHDGSIFSQKEFGRQDTLCAEFVMRRPYGKDGFFSALREFEGFFKGKPLHEVVAFNKSCGNHIHFSIKDLEYTKSIKKRIMAIYGNELNNILRRAFIADKVLSIELKKSIMQHYYRQYAKKCEYKGERYQELNWCKENTLEWRSFNLRGCKTWVEFYRLFEIALNVIEQFLKNIIDNNFSYMADIDVNLRELSRGRIWGEEHIRLDMRDIGWQLRNIVDNSTILPTEYLEDITKRYETEAKQLREIKIDDGDVLRIKHDLTFIGVDIDNPNIEAENPNQVWCSTCNMYHDER